MDYEKKYKEALERAKVEQETFYNLSNISAKTAIERIFPELGDNEDERIRKELIAFLNHYHTGQGKTVVYDNDWISWLEKQGQESKKVSIE